MKVKRDRVTLIGGYLTSAEALGPVADTLYAHVARKIEVFDLLDAMKHPDEVAKSIQDGLVFAYSAGMIAVEKWMQPQEIVACVGPEPRNYFQLTKGLLAARRTCLNSAREGGPYAQRYADSVKSSMAQLRRHPLEYLGHLPTVSDFSTIDRLNASISAGIKPAALVSAGDELFPHTGTLDYGEVPIHIHEGGHARLLVEPHAVLEPWTSTLQ